VFGPVTLGLIPVTVTSRVVGYLRRRLTGEVIDFIDLDMPAHTLATTAVMYTLTPDALSRRGIHAPRIPGSLHAAEHAAIGLLPLVASCDRGDIGGLSTPIGPDPLAPLPSVFVYDGRGDARRACSPLSAAAATSRWTRRVRFGCCVWWSPRWRTTRRSDRRG
jgi:DEAD/DEAH box helicase domain-containing protein